MLSECPSASCGCPPPATATLTGSFAFLNQGKLASRNPRPRRARVAQPFVLQLDILIFSARACHKLLGDQPRLVLCNLYNDPGHRPSAPPTLQAVTSCGSVGGLPVQVNINATWAPSRHMHGSVEVPAVL